MFARSVSSSVFGASRKSTRRSTNGEWQLKHQPTISDRPSSAPTARRVHGPTTVARNVTRPMHHNRTQPKQNVRQRWSRSVRFARTAHNERSVEHARNCDQPRSRRHTSLKTRMRISKRPAPMRKLDICDCVRKSDNCFPHNIPLQKSKTCCHGDTNVCWRTQTEIPRDIWSCCLA